MDCAGEEVERRTAREMVMVGGKIAWTETGL